MNSTLQSDLEKSIRGDVRFDRLSRTLYSADASIYEIVPTGVVLPRDHKDVLRTVDVCGEHGVPITARGAGTGLAGGAVGSGVQLDCSRYLRDMGEPDFGSRTIRVEAGVVLDELNARLRPHGVHFAPDVATSSRATIGGMIANNSCGAHSVIYGRTVDHVASMTCVLSDGSTAVWPADGTQRGSRGEGISQRVERIAADCSGEIRERYPKVLRSNGGYALDRLCDGGNELEAGTLVCGSEGTLCVVTEAVLKLTPLPRYRGLVLVQFDDLLDSLSATPEILQHGPAAVELIDRMILRAAARDAVGSRCRFIEPDVEAVLVVEFFANDEAALDESLRRLRGDLEGRGIGKNVREVKEPRDQRSVWAVRERGLGLLMSRPGDRQSYAFVEDSAVDPHRLREYIERFRRVLEEEGVGEAAFYAHASVGVIHVRPVLNLKTAEDVERMRRTADRVSDLALEFGGAMTGEHGDGILRSCWLEKMYGKRIVAAFGEVKSAFDPAKLFNPGKIVDPWPMTEHLRYGPSHRTRELKTHLDYSEHGGMGGLAQMCGGVGDCRQRSGGTMCPSFTVTGDETHTTRARANALRVALSNRGLLEGLGDPALDEVMDLCVLCKACKTECPTGVDMARMKVEWLAQRNMRRGVSRGARFVASAARWARLGSRLPRTANLLTASRPVRAWLEARYGLDRRVAPPRLAARTFASWFKRYRRRRRPWREGDRNVVYYADTWTNYYTPEVGIAAVRLLDAAGYRVLVPSLRCCGRPLISKGLLTEAKALAEANVARLAPFADTQTPILGSEPSCILTLCDEYPRLVRSADAKATAGLAQTVESFLSSAIDAGEASLRFTGDERRILYHAHCHEKALVGHEAALKLLNLPEGFSAEEIGSGCCGMAGAFGHEKEHFEVARAMGEYRLFPALRDRGEAEAAVSGFSCRHQILTHTGCSARHTLEHLADVLVPGSEGSAGWSDSAP